MPVVLSEATAQKLQEVLAVTPRSPGQSGANGGSGGSRTVAFVRVTGAIYGDGFYPGLPTQYVTFDDDWEDYLACKIIGANSETLVSGTRYLSVRVGDDEDGTAVFVAVQGGAGDPPSGCSDLVALRTTDCVLATGPGAQSRLLEYGAGTWTNASAVTYPDGDGVLVLSFTAGVPTLSLDGIPLLWCGGGCFSGGPRTGHDTSSGDSCTGESFSVCLACQACEEEEPVETTCCEGTPIPTTLYATYSGGTGSCDCLDGVTVTMTYNAGSGYWVGGPDGGTCGYDVYTWLRCASGNWRLGQSGNAIEPSIEAELVGAALDCEPFSLSGVLESALCPFPPGGSVTVTITETPP